MFRLIDRCVEVAAVLAFAASSILIIINVFNRYVVSGLMRNLSKQFEGFKPVYLFFREHVGSLSITADEVPGLLLVWIAFLGAYLAMRREGHISFEMILEALPLKFKKLVLVFNATLMAVFLLLLFFQSIRMIRVSGRTEIETAEIAQGWFMLVLPLAAVLLLAALAHRTFKSFSLSGVDK